MPFPWTLQRYLLRELSKTFFLAAIALTAIVGLGGGILNMIKLGESTPGQLLRMMTLVLPLAIAMTLPIAALFAASATYGRFSADNEFVACRASGINLHILFFPGLVLSLFAAVIGFLFSNFLIPGMVRNLNQLVGADVGTLIEQRLNKPSGGTLDGKYRLHADEFVTDPAHPERIILRGVAFVEVDNDQWVRFGTATEAAFTVDTSKDGFRVSGVMTGVSFFDRKAGQFFEADRQEMVSRRFDSPVPQKIKFLDLAELLHYLHAPAEWIEVREHIDRLRQATGRLMIFDELAKEWKRGSNSLTLKDENGSLRISSKSAAMLPEGGGIELSTVTVDQESNGVRRQATADRAVIDVAKGKTLQKTAVVVELYDAKLSDGTNTINRSKHELAPVAISTAMLKRIANLTQRDLLTAQGSQLEDPLSVKRKQARAARDETRRRILGAINERLAFSLSVFALVILGAALGIIFRGAHVMTAFGISFVPLLFVLVTIVTGKQMAHNEATQILGLMVIWSGITVVVGLDVWTLFRVLRR